MSAPQTLTLHSHRKSITIIYNSKFKHADSVLAGPNPWKIALLLEEFNVPYTTKVHTTPELKQPSFLAINPNGMAPVIEDLNTDLVLAEVKFPLPFLSIPR